MRAAGRALHDRCEVGDDVAQHGAPFDGDDQVVGQRAGHVCGYSLLQAVALVAEYIAATTATITSSSVRGVDAFLVVVEVEQRLEDISQRSQRERKPLQKLAHPRARGEPVDSVLERKRHRGAQDRHDASHRRDRSAIRRHDAKLALASRGLVERSRIVLGREVDADALAPVLLDLVVVRDDELQERHRLPEVQQLAVVHAEDFEVAQVWE